MQRSSSRFCVQFYNGTMQYGQGWRLTEYNCARSGSEPPLEGGEHSAADSENLSSGGVAGSVCVHEFDCGFSPTALHQSTMKLFVVFCFTKDEELLGQLGCPARSTLEYANCLKSVLASMPSYSLKSVPVSVLSFLGS